MTIKVHEHIIRVAEPEMTRDMLWKGLEDFVRHPEDFVEHMDSSKTLSETDADGQKVLEREICFGNFTLRDRVTLQPQEVVTTHVDAGATWPASTFVMKIEEPEKGSLFVRFIYEEDGNGRGETNPMVLELRQRAYEAKDQALIEKIMLDAIKPAAQA